MISLQRCRSYSSISSISFIRRLWWWLIIIISLGIFFNSPLLYAFNITTPTTDTTMITSSTSTARSTITPITTTPVKNTEVIRYDKKKCIFCPSYSRPKMSLGHNSCPTKVEDCECAPGYFMAKNSYGGGSCRPNYYSTIEPVYNDDAYPTTITTTKPMTTTATTNKYYGNANNNNDNNIQNQYQPSWCDYTCPINSISRYYFGKSKQTCPKGFRDCLCDFGYTPHRNMCVQKSHYDNNDKKNTPYPATPYPTTPRPTKYPTTETTHSPTNNPTPYPTHHPTAYPTHHPTHHPTSNPTPYPTHHPTPHPTKKKQKCYYQCPYYSHIKYGLSDCPKSIDDCDCYYGYTKYGQYCYKAMKIPTKPTPNPTSRPTPNPTPNPTRYYYNTPSYSTKTKQHCYYECPDYSRKKNGLLDCPKSLNDCDCYYGYTKYGHYCAKVKPTTTTPNPTYRPIPNPTAHPTLSQYNKPSYSIPSYPTKSKQHQQCYYTCPENSVVKHSLLDCPKSIYDCVCNDGYKQYGHYCARAKPTTTTTTTSTMMTPYVNNYYNYYDKNSGSGSGYGAGDYNNNYGGYNAGYGGAYKFGGYNNHYDPHGGNYFFSFEEEEGGEGEDEENEEEEKQGKESDQNGSTRRRNY